MCTVIHLCLGEKAISVLFIAFMMFRVQKVHHQSKAVGSFPSCYLHIVQPFTLFQHHTQSKLFLSGFQLCLKPPPPFHLSHWLSVLADIQTVSEDIMYAETQRSGFALRPLKGSYFAKRFTACLTLREKKMEPLHPCAGVWMMSQAHALLYQVLNKGAAGFTSSSDEGFNVGKCSKQ